MRFYLLFCVIVVIKSAEVTLSWTYSYEPPNNGVIGFKLYYKEDPTSKGEAPWDGKGALEGNSPITIWLQNLTDIYNCNITLHGLPIATYCFSISAFNSQLESEKSGSVCKYVNKTTSAEFGKLKNIALGITIPIIIISVVVLVCVICFIAFGGCGIGMGTNKKFRQSVYNISLKITRPKKNVPKRHQRVFDEKV